MGHSDVSLTMRVYAQIDDQQKREAVNLLPSMHDMRKQKFRIVQGEK